MAVQIPTGAIRNLQQIEAVVAGPDDANRLFIIDGQFDSRVEVETHGGSSTQKETFSVLVGPVFNKHQFSRAIATASFIKTSFASGGGGAGAGWYILGVDADWDDGAQRCEGHKKSRPHCSLYAHPIGRGNSYGSLNSTSCSCVSITLPASS